MHAYTQQRDRKTPFEFSELVLDQRTDFYGQLLLLRKVGDEERTGDAPHALNRRNQYFTRVSYAFRVISNALKIRRDLANARAFSKRTAIIKVIMLVKS